METIFREIATQELSLELFARFDRFQEVTQCWRLENDDWILKDIAFVENWEESEKRILVECLQNTIRTKGAVFAAFQKDTLVGFASLESAFFGSKGQYLELSSIHITHGLRGMGIGGRLFGLICRRAKEMGAEKLYISAHSSKESQAFYQKIGCRPAEEINKASVEKEPCDCQLEFDLRNARG